MLFRKLVQRVNRYLYNIGYIAIFIMIILTVIDVSGRYFGYPLPGAAELVQLSLAVMFAFVIAHTQAKKRHIDIDILFVKMPARAQAIISIVTSSLSLIFLSLVAWSAIPWILVSRRMSAWTDIFQLPVWPFKAALFIGILCFCLQLILDIVDSSRELRGPHGDPT